MKTIVTAIAAAGLLFAASAAKAQSNMSAGAEVKSDTSMNAPVRHTTRHHRSYHRHTTGIGSENNASARGSQLPGKDKLNSKAYLQTH